MNLTVTIQTCAQNHLARGQRTAGKASAAKWLAVVQRTVVTGLAEVRRPLLEQARLYGAMGRVADRAIFLHRRMLPQERTAFFVVAR